jgi:hypothetical protein
MTASIHNCTPLEINFLCLCSVWRRATSLIGRSGLWSNRFIGIGGGNIMIDK